MISGSCKAAALLFSFLVFGIMFSGCINPSRLANETIASCLSGVLECSKYGESCGVVATTGSSQVVKRCCEGTCVDHACQKADYYTCPDGSVVRSESDCPQVSLEQIDSCLCTVQWDPVCGVDGKTYENKCFAMCRQVDVAYDGPCGNICVKEGLPCGSVGILSTAYASTQVCCNESMCIHGVCQRPHENTCLNGSLTHSLLASPVNCLNWNCCGCQREWNPVCIDGKTYASRCIARCAGIDLTLAVDGECGDQQSACFREGQPCYYYTENCTINNQTGAKTCQRAREIHCCDNLVCSEGYCKQPEPTCARPGELCNNRTCCQGSTCTQSSAGYLTANIPQQVCVRDSPCRNTGDSCSPNTDTCCEPNTVCAQDPTILTHVAYTCRNTGPTPTPTVTPCVPNNGACSPNLGNCCNTTSACVQNPNVYTHVAYWCAPTTVTPVPTATPCIPDNGACSPNLGNCCNTTSACVQNPNVYTHVAYWCAPSQPTPVPTPTPSPCTQTGSACTPNANSCCNGTACVQNPNVYTHVAYWCSNLTATPTPSPTPYCAYEYCSNGVYFYSCWYDPQVLGCRCTGSVPCASQVCDAQGNACGPAVTPTPMPTAVYTTCIDYDHLGQVDETYVPSYVQQSVNGNYTEYYDYCNGTVLYEYRCNDVPLAQAYPIQCRYGCANGACLQASEPTPVPCSETDSVRGNGNNQYTVGTTTGTLTTGGSGSFTDYCLDTTRLYEYYCESPGQLPTVLTQIHECRYCADGACQNPA